MQYSSTFIYSLVLAVPLLVYGLASLVATDATARFLVAFPRNRVAGCVLTVIGWFWTAHELDVIGISFFDSFLKVFPGEVWILAAVLSVLTCLWMPNLLPLRGVSAVFMLFPATVLPALRLEPSAWRLVAVSVCYVCLSTGMFGMFYPWRVRQALAWRAASPMRVRAAGAAFLAVGALLVVAAFMG